MATKPVAGKLAPRAPHHPRAPLLVAAGLGVALSGCTGSDLSIAMGPNGPVPPADIGSASTLGAPPASTALADAAPLAASPSGSVVSAPLSPEPAIGRSPLAPATSTRGGASPQMRWAVGAQPVGQDAEPAPQIASVSEPAASQPAATQPAPYEQPAEEAAADEAPPLRQASLAPAAGEPPLRPAAMRGQVSPSSARTEVQFLPVVGAPQHEAELLARALSEESKKAGVAIRPASDAVAAIRLKGYFSAFEDGGDTVLVYVWDVLDKDDQRIRRIQGEERIADTAQDPWSKVDLETLRKVARETFQEAATVGSSVG
ncbi:hypothetical protein [Jiella sonneratiae]|uniref:Lipoprotein n=1 Tax=Jiella sonneratiae TaxID=2816856 RepID=A0ABS3J9N9_9HYPH|nr:hypothetical protein [Jiella sonneratiae]MBO0906394.1 hypothetical protein [Jiella sonneratiae]